MTVIYTDYFFLDFVIPIVKYNIYGLGRFADNHFDNIQKLTFQSPVNY